MARLTEVLAIIPVLNRPDRAKILAKSWKQSKTPGDLVFVASGWDELELSAVENVLESFNHGEIRLMKAPGGVDSWPKKVDWAWKRLQKMPDTPEWMLLAADDVDFHPGWWEATADLRSDPQIQVIGTNDLGNQRVTSGEHAVHPLVRRDFKGIGSQSPVWPGYRHWFVDDELVYTAKARGVWSPCLESVVEHLHPYWQKGEWDDTYTLGEAESGDDRALFESRQPLIYAEGRPFPHIVMDGMFTPDALKEVLEEWPDEADPRWKRFASGAHETGKWEGSDPSMFGPVTNEVLRTLGEGFCPLVEHLTGIQPLWPSILGGGYHEIQPGGALGIHADFNTAVDDEDRTIYRRVNALLFLNERYNPTWGGQLELHGDDGFVQTIEPRFGRLVLFSTADNSWHGHPQPLEFPPGTSRKSLAIYFFSDRPARGQGTNEHSTIFKDLP